MLIHGAHNRSVSFELFAFEAEIKTFCPEEDWIEIAFRINDEKRKWHVTDASLTAEEVMKLVKWLQDLSVDKAAEKDLHFLEPNLSFHYMFNYGKTKIILINLHAELRPEWYEEEGLYSILGHVGNRQLTMMADELTLQLCDLYEKTGVHKEQVAIKTL